MIIAPRRQALGPGRTAVPGAAVWRPQRPSPRVTPGHSARTLAVTHLGTCRSEESFGILFSFLFFWATGRTGTVR
eukprot:253406-Hanusia_phi.AAC.1